MHCCALESLPDSFGNLSSLKALDIRSSSLLSFPESIGQLSSLKSLTIDARFMRSRQVSVPTTLHTLRIKCLYPEDILNSLGDVSSLKELTVERDRVPPHVSSTRRAMEVFEGSLDASEIRVLGRDSLMEDLMSLKMGVFGRQSLNLSAIRDMGVFEPQSLDLSAIRDMGVFERSASLLKRLLECLPRARHRRQRRRLSQ
ncbi:unnamed protein product [Calypogeia fissa]